MALFFARLLALLVQVGRKTVFRGSPTARRRGMMVVHPVMTIRDSHSG
jgi:hypothetical protein